VNSKENILSLSVQFLCDFCGDTKKHCGPYSSYSFYFLFVFSLSFSESGWLGFFESMGLLFSLKIGFKPTAFDSLGFNFRGFNDDGKRVLALHSILWFFGVYMVFI